MKQFLILSLGVILLFSCKKAAVDCVDTNYTYNADVKSVMDKNCNVSGCHNSGSSSGDFTTYAKLKPYLDSGMFNERVFVVGDMPKNRLITFKNKSILQCWMENGFKEN